VARNSPQVITRRGLGCYTLRASQLVAPGPAEAFSFFENPGNLSAITPSWLGFRVVGDCGGRIFRGAEYDYTIRWFGLTIPWRTRITEYTPGISFTDSQIRGPYRTWVHRHTFEEKPEGTLMEDRVDLAIPLAALPLSSVIRRQLGEIFSFRARRITGWVEGTARQARV
jgi:ligand-binding SRPBCC domain-containing protein